MSTFAAVHVQNAEFVFKLGGDWVSVPSSDTSQFSFESKSSKTSVVLSMMARTIPEGELTGVAVKFAEIRQKAEHDSRPGQTIHWGDKWVQLRPTRDVAEVAYAGYDSKMIFRFFCLNIVGRQSTEVITISVELVLTGFAHNCE